MTDITVPEFDGNLGKDGFRHPGGLAIMRDHYIAYRMLRRQLEHPGTPEAKARKYARVAWHRKVLKWQQDGILPKL